MNTCILYLYRGACNYKMYNEVIINGILSPEQINSILNCLNDGEYFIPSQVGLPEQRFGCITEDDHCWFELNREGFNLSSDIPTIDITPCELVDKFMKAKDNWNDDIGSFM